MVVLCLSGRVSDLLSVCVKVLEIVFVGQCEVFVLIIYIFFFFPWPRSS